MIVTEGLGNGSLNENTKSKMGPHLTSIYVHLLRTQWNAKLVCSIMHKSFWEETQQNKILGYKNKSSNGLQTHVKPRQKLLAEFNPLKKKKKSFRKKNELP